MSSWIFGNRKDVTNFTDFVPPSNAVEGGGSDKPPNKEMDAYRFDSAALERAANAAKDLEKSKFAKEALDLAKLQEATKQAEVEAKKKEFELHVEQLKIDARSREYEEKRKFLHEQAKIDQQKAQYQDQLSRKRYEDQLMHQQKLNEENIRNQEESVARQEALKRETFEREFEKAAQRDQRKIDADYAARGKYERENKEFIFDQMRQEKEQERETLIKKLREERQTKLESLKSLSSTIGYGIDQFISNPEKIRNVAVATVGIFAGIYAMKRSSEIVLNSLEAYLLKPRIVRNTSRISALDFVTHPIKTCKKLKKKSSDILDGVILHPSVDARVRDIALSTKNTKKNKGYFRSVILYGPPGTGKTMFAERLATASGMDYAIVAGGDLTMAGKDSLNQLNKLFNWAEASRKGTVLFIDEADAFMFKRKDGASEEHNKILSAFLHRTGTLSKKFSVVMATNRPDAFDYAINSRSHEFVVFPLPTFEERHRLVMKYFTDFILIPSTTGIKRLTIGELDYKKVCLEVAKLTDDFSGRDIANLANDWQATTYASPDGRVTEELMMARTISAIQQNNIRKKWYSEEEKARERFSAALMKSVFDSAVLSKKPAADESDVDKTSADTSEKKHIDDKNK